jgi:hypothetical protein
MRRSFWCFLIFFFLLGISLPSQNLLSRREKPIVLTGDTIVLDTLSIIPGTFSLYTGTVLVDTLQYQLLPAEAKLILRPPCPRNNLRVSYQVYPILFSKNYSHKNQQVFTSTPDNRVNPFLYRPGELKTTEDPFATGSLNKSGSLSRGIAFGNNRDVSVNSSLNLQLSGKLTENLDLAMAATDDNLPIQPDGTTQQLQEFDRVYIQLSGKGTKLLAGDFFIYRPQSYFMNFNKRGQGLTVTSLQSLGGSKADSASLKVSAAAAVSKGKFARQIIQGVEGNQGPYRLRGAENELFIIVLSGTEKVFVDGKQLVRGQENDYVIDYNTAEITFTAKQLITKDKRIVVEFQYSDRNYARSLLYTGIDYQRANYGLHFHAYSEQDNKNRPVQQTLTDADKLTLANVGDTLLRAIVPGVDSVAFSGDLVLYRKTDSLVVATLYPDVYVYSTDPNQAHYRLSFSYVGINRGNYIQISSSANGKTFQWIAPINNVPQGEYEPVILLVTPKKKQLLSFGGNTRMSFGTLDAELAYSRNDLNTFSPVNSDDDQGYGANLNFATKYKINDSLAFDFGAKYELVSHYFSPLERYRSVEFERDWNFGWGGASRIPTADQHIASFTTGINGKRLNRIGYTFSMFREGIEFTGIKHETQVNAVRNGFALTGWASLLSTNSPTSNTSFLRQRFQLSKNFAKKYQLKIWEDQEINQRRTPGNSLLQSNSNAYLEWEASAGFADTSKRTISFFYRQRRDQLPSVSDLQLATFAESYGGTIALNGRPNQQLRITTSWRKLSIRSSQLTTQQPENTLIGRFEYSLRAWKGVFTSSTFYETGSGLELKREYTYVEVPTGQGSFTWTDYNGDGVKQLNEFENALYLDQANYIRVFTPTNNYIRVFTNQFSQSVNIRPSVKWGNKKGFAGIVARFSDQAVYRVDRKTMSREAMHVYVPQLSDAGDTALVALNATVRNTLFFNQLSSKFGMDYTYQDVRGKNLLTNGIESRSNTYHEMRLRWNITKAFALVTEYRDGQKKNNSEFFSTRNFRIKYYEVEPRFSYQPGTTFRLSFSYRYSDKRNAADLGNEKAQVQKFGTELKLNKLSKGSLLAEFNYFRMDYTGTVSSAVGYDMLEGLKPGQNFTWKIAWQRSLAQNLQLTLGYEGRKTPNANMIHTGTAQVRAVF